MSYEIMSDPDIQSGAPCIAGTRVPATDVAQCYAELRRELDHDAAIAELLATYGGVPDEPAMMACARWVEEIGNDPDGRWDKSLPYRLSVNDGEQAIEISIKSGSPEIILSVDDGWDGVAAVMLGSDEVRRLSDVLIRVVDFVERHGILPQEARHGR